MPALKSTAITPSAARLTESLRDMPAEQLAAELQRRGWIVTKP